MPGMVACACHLSTGQAGTVDLGTKGLASLAQLVSSGPVRVPVWKEEDVFLRMTPEGCLWPPYIHVHTCLHMPHTRTPAHTYKHTRRISEEINQGLVNLMRIRTMGQSGGALTRLEREDCVLEVSLGYTGSNRSAWAT